jgi:hypothetical protein
MFIEPEELKTALYAYQMDEITEDDNGIVTAAIETAVEEVKAYPCFLDRVILIPAQCRLPI